MATHSEQENFFERSAWVLFLVIGLLEILFGWGDIIVQEICFKPVDKQSKSWQRVPLINQGVPKLKVILSF